MSEKTKIAVIGLGSIGTIVATNLVKGNRAVIIADRTFDKASKLANELGELATPRQIADAFSEADIIVLAVWFNTIQDIFKNNGPELENKLLSTLQIQLHWTKRVVLKKLSELMNQLV